MPTLEEKRSLATAAVIGELAEREGTAGAAKAMNDPAAFVFAIKRVVAALATEAKTAIGNARGGFASLSLDAIEDLLAQASTNIDMIREIGVLSDPKEMPALERELGKLEQDISDLSDKVLESKLAKRREMN
jgi:hypothetical protein